MNIASEALHFKNSIFKSSEKLLKIQQVKVAVDVPYLSVEYKIPMKNKGHQLQRQTYY